MPPRAGEERLGTSLEREGGRTTPPGRPPLLRASPRPGGVGAAFALFLGREGREERFLQKIFLMKEEDGPLCVPRRGSADGAPGAARSQKGSAWAWSFSH
eukprot:2383664-Pyramimonas_sp.AAC.1